ncbi:hypothetical protein [Pseudomonas alabamensis]|uniref:hypothetical protein n=1 Tax=Pseudomonas alabamensis TaxID=3064349 RepID=UPI003F652ADA
MSSRTQQTTLSIRGVENGLAGGRPLRSAHFLVVSPAWRDAEARGPSAHPSREDDPQRMISDPLKRSLALAGEWHGVFASALFVSITDTGHARVLGRMNAAAWRQWADHAAS